jgi:hypothetical protein
MSSFRICPTSNPGVTRMEFDYYHLESGDKFEDYFKFVRQVAIEDFELCEKAQENLEKGVYNEGILNPEKETGVACKFGNPREKEYQISRSADFGLVYQEKVFDMVSQQFKLDKKEQLVEEENNNPPLLGPGVVSAAA